jgi:hypothetical protein
LTILLLIILVTAGMATWLLRNQATRTQWTVSAVFAGLVWIVGMLLSLRIPEVFKFSVWQPEVLFQSPLLLSMDRISWVYLYAMATVLLAMIFTAAARPTIAPAGVRAFWFLYSGLSIVAILAANLLTLAITWALMDLMTLVFYIRLAESPGDVQRALVRSGFDMVGVLLLLAGASLNHLAGGDTLITTPFLSTSAALLVVLAALLRLGLMPLHFGISGFEPLRRGLGTLLRLFPPAVSLALLTRLFDIGLPEGTTFWLLLAGVVGTFIGGIRWVLEADVIRSRPFFVLTISSLAVLAGLSPSGVEGSRAAGVILLLMGATLSLIEIHSPAHKVWPLLVALVLIGLPWTPGGILAESFGGSFLAGGLSLRIVAGTLGLSTLGLGALHIFYEVESPWPTSESLVRLMYGLGLALPVLVSIGLGIWFHTLPALGGLIIFATAGLFMALGFLGLRRLPANQVQRWQSLAGKIDPQPVYRLFWIPLRRTARYMRSVGMAFEGDGAMIWMFVVVLFLVLALGVG